MPTVDFKPFAIANDANVISQNDYLALAALQNGFLAGLAKSSEVNKVLRQASTISAALANFIANATNQNVVDDGNLATLIANLTAAISASARVQPARVITASVNTTLLNTDNSIALSRLVAPAAMVITLPANPINGQVIEIADIAGNMSAFPVAVQTNAAPASQSIANLTDPTFYMNIDRQVATFKYFQTANAWSVK